jgi:hypothetical protein
MISKISPMHGKSPIQHVFIVFGANAMNESAYIPIVTESQCSIHSVKRGLAYCNRTPVELRAIIHSLDEGWLTADS